MRRLSLLLLLATLAVVTVACGSDDKTETSDTTLPSTTLPGGGETVVGPQVGDRAEAKPQVEVPDPLQTELYTEDLVVGDGPEVPAGATVTVEYVGVLPDGSEFDSSWNTPAPATFSLDQVIPGWTQGIPGMKVGGRRLLVIPGDLAYGAQGSPPKIGPDQTLVFIVDMVDYQVPPPTTAPVIPEGATGVPPTG